jgi:betaine reductase
MKFQGHLAKNLPVLEDVLGGAAALIEQDDQASPVLRLDVIGRHKVSAGGAAPQIMQALAVEPLVNAGLPMTAVDDYATELHNPEITEPHGGGNVPDRNYKMLAGLGVVRGELTREDIPRFARAHGVPGFAPTQGHIASAVPWLPHALARMKAGDLHSTMLIAKGSLFLGRLTRLWDGVSVTLEA